MHQSLQNFKPDIIYVSLGAPKQEIFTNQHLRGYTDVKFIANIGAALNFFAGTEKRAPKFLQKIGLEGIYRIFIDLKKHLTKDFKSYPFIIKEIIKVKLYEKRKKH
jgi:N-acetylglucosaminyldiphosphoundecaprenol N-acetyl-beta-D-mannosaminyltransferase